MTPMLSALWRTVSELVVSNGEEEAVFGPSTTMESGAHIWCLALHNGYMYSGDASGMICAWDIQDVNGCEAPLWRIRAHDAAVYALLSISDGTLLSSGSDGCLCAWRATDGAGEKGHAVWGRLERVSVLSPSAKGASVPLLALARAGSGEIFTGDAAGDIHRSLLQTPSKLATTHMAPSGSSTVYCLRVIEGARALVSGGADGCVVVWQCESLERLCILSHAPLRHPSPCSCVSTIAAAAEIDESTGRQPVSSRSWLVLGAPLGGVRACLVRYAPAGRTPSSQLLAFEPLLPLGREDSREGSAEEAAGPLHAKVTALCGFGDSDDMAVSVSIDGHCVLWRLSARCALRIWLADERCEMKSVSPLVRSRAISRTISCDLAHRARMISEAVEGCSVSARLGSPPSPPPSAPLRLRQLSPTSDAVLNDRPERLNAKTSEIVCRRCLVCATEVRALVPGLAAACSHFSAALVTRTKEAAMPCLMCLMSGVAEPPARSRAGSASSLISISDARQKTRAREAARARQTADDRPPTGVPARLSSSSRTRRLRSSSDQIRSDRARWCATRSRWVQNVRRGRRSSQIGVRSTRCECDSTHARPTLPTCTGSRGVRASDVRTARLEQAPGGTSVCAERLSTCRADSTGGASMGMAAHSRRV